MRASFRPLRKLFRREKLTNADRFTGEEEKNCTSSKDRSQFFFREEIQQEIDRTGGRRRWTDPFWNRNKRGSMEKKKKKSVEGPSGTLVFAERAYPLERALVKSCQISRDLLSRAIYREFSGFDGGEARLRGSSRVHRSALALSFPPSSLCSFRASFAFQRSRCKTLLSGRTHNYQS